MTQTRPQTRFARFRADMWRTKWLHLLALPAVIYLAIFQYGPMYGVLMAFQNFRVADGIWGSEWVGLHHFQAFINHPHFFRVVTNTITLNVYMLIFVFPLPIVFALLLNELRGQVFKRTVQTVSYLPNFISMPAIIGMMIMFVSPTHGFINQIIEFFGGSAIHFMARPEWFRPLFIISEVWTTLGWSAIIYIAALAGVNPELYESAVLDGASRVKMMRHISIPSIAPTIIILFLLNVGTIMSLGHEKALLMQNSLNMATGDIISTFVFRHGIIMPQHSFATAVSVFNSAINIVVLMTANQISRRISETSLW